MAPNSPTWISWISRMQSASGQQNATCSRGIRRYRMTITCLRMLCTKLRPLTLCNQPPACRQPQHRTGRKKKSSKIKFHPKFSFQKALRLWMALMLSPHKKPKKKRCKHKDGASFTSLTLPYDHITPVRGQRPAPLDAATWALSPRGRKLSSGWGWLCRYGRSRSPGPPLTEPLETSAVATCTSPWIPSHDFYVRCEWNLLCKSRPLRRHMSYNLLIYIWHLQHTSEIRRAVDLQTVPVSKSNHLLAPHISPTITNPSNLSRHSPQWQVPTLPELRRSVRQGPPGPGPRFKHIMIYVILFYLISYIISYYIRLFKLNQIRDW